MDNLTKYRMSVTWRGPKSQYGETVFARTLEDAKEIVRRRFLEVRPGDYEIVSVEEVVYETQISDNK